MADGDLPSIEEEFAQLNTELERIAALPLRTPEQQNALVVALESLRDAWQQKGKGQPGLPEWRRVVDAAIGTAFDGVLGELRAAASAGHGKLQLDAQLLQRHLKPVLDEIANGLRRNLVQKFGTPPPPGAPPLEVEAADVAGILLTLFGPPPKKK
jgi:hypothetical protein